MDKNLRYLFYAVLASSLWGLSFVGIKWANPAFDVFWIIFLRNLIAFACGIPVLIKNKSWKKTKLLLGPLIAGGIVFLMFVFQTWGLEYTTVAKSSFIVSMSALFTPLYFLIFTKRRYSLFFWPILFMAIMGVFLMCEMQIENFNFGDILTLFASFACVMQMVYLEKIARRFKSPIEFNTIQCLSVFVLSGLAVLLFGQTPNWELAFAASETSLITPFIGIIILGFFCSFCAFSLQVASQMKLPAHLIALIFLLEAPFASLWAYLFISETLSHGAFLGACMITSAVFFVPFLRVRNENML